jgi:hypothetical protein
MARQASPAVRAQVAETALLIAQVEAEMAVILDYLFTVIEEPALDTSAAAATDLAELIHEVGTRLAKPDQEPPPPGSPPELELVEQALRRRRRSTSGGE